eukprot:958370-Pleurochrysis_carterae.AAC.1
MFTTQNNERHCQSRCAAISPRCHDRPSRLAVEVIQSNLLQPSIGVIHNNDSSSSDHTPISLRSYLLTACAIKSKRRTTETVLDESDSEWNRSSRAIRIEPWQAIRACRCSSISRRLSSISAR